MCEWASALPPFLGSLHSHQPLPQPPTTGEPRHAPGQARKLAVCWGGAGARSLGRLDSAADATDAHFLFLSSYLFYSPSFSLLEKQEVIVGSVGNPVTSTL